VTHPEQPITCLSFLTPTEEQQFAHWNQTAVDYPEICVHDCFTEQAAKTPNQIAVIAGEQQLTDQSLNQAANQLAHYLQQQGIQPHDVVGISLGRNPFLPIAVLAVLKAGAAYVPLDPNYPEDRLAFMLEDSQAKVVLTQTDISKQLPQAVPQLELEGNCPSERLSQSPRTNGRTLDHEPL